MWPEIRPQSGRRDVRRQGLTGAFFGLVLYLPWLRSLTPVPAILALEGPKIGPAQPLSMNEGACLGNTTLG